MMSLNNEPRRKKELRKYNIHSELTIEQYTVKNKTCNHEPPELNTFRGKWVKRIPATRKKFHRR